MTQDIVGVNGYTDVNGTRNTVEDYSTVIRAYGGEEGVMWGLTVSETSPQSAAINISSGVASINCNNEEFLTFKLATGIIALTVPNTGTAKHYLVCLKVNLGTPSSEFVIVEGTTGTDPNLTEAGQIYYLPIARIEHAGGGVNIVNSEIVQDGVTLTNNSTIEAIYKPISGWRQIGETWTYASAKTVTVAGDKSGMYKVGMRVKIMQDDIVKYFVISNISFVSPTTTITLSGGVVANSVIDEINISNEYSPSGIDGAKELHKEIVLSNNFFI